jgi:NADH:ubiquinone oxidoreductase subunit K
MLIPTTTVLQGAQSTGPQLPELLLALLVFVLLAAPVAAAVGLVIVLRRKNTTERIEALEQRVAELERRR